METLSLWHFCLVWHFVLSFFEIMTARSTTHTPEVLVGKAIQSNRSILKSSTNFTQNYFSWLIVSHIFQKCWALLSHLSITHCTLSLQQRTVSHDQERLEEQSSCDCMKEWNSTLNRQQEQYKMVCLKQHSWTDCTNWHVRNKIYVKANFLPLMDGSYTTASIYFPL